MPNYTANRAVLSRQPYSVGDASDVTRLRRLDTGSTVIPTKWSPYRFTWLPTLQSLPVVVASQLRPQTWNGGIPSEVTVEPAVFSFTNSGQDPSHPEIYYARPAESFVLNAGGAVLNEPYALEIAEGDTITTLKFEFDQLDPPYIEAGIIQQVVVGIVGPSTDGITNVHIVDGEGTTNTLDPEDYTIVYRESGLHTVAITVPNISVSSIHLEADGFTVVNSLRYYV